MKWKLTGATRPLAAALAVLFAVVACDQDQQLLEPTDAPGPNFARIGPPPGTEFTPHHPSQEVECRVVDNAISMIPKGDGDGTVTDDEVGIGGWRFSGAGGSFVTFNFDWDGAQYAVVAGRSNVGGNVPDDYPEFLNLPQAPSEGQRVFTRTHGEIVFSGDPSDPPQFALPGRDEGDLRVSLRFVGMDNGDRVYEGCAATPLLKNFGFVRPEGGDFVQREYFKVWARTDGDFNVEEWEFTEISTFNNTDPEES